MRKRQQDIGPSGQSEPADSAESPSADDGDTVIELVDGIPYIYEKGAVNEAVMERKR